MYSGETQFEHGIVIDRDLTIYGNDITIDGNGKARIFHVTAGNVTFRNINFVNGNAGGDLDDGWGGAVRGACTAVDCNFTGNNAQIQGGAMHNGVAVNCTFANNRALYRGGAMSGGSAINCTFVNNSASYGGGAISFGSAIDCNFTNNTADGGGAMDGGSALNCTFVNNTAQDGGAISMAIAINCTFVNNWVSKDGGAILGGSALNCTFRANHADKSGGAMYGAVGSNCNFIDNTANFGGAMNGGGALNCTFVNNTAESGGAMFGGSAALCVLDYGECSNTEIVRDLLAVSDFTSVYGSGEGLLFNLVYGEYVFNGFNTTISVSQNGAPVGTYYALSGEEWRVNLTKGAYDAKFSVEGYDVNPVTVKLKITDGTTFCDLNKTINGNQNSTIDLGNDYTFDSALDSDFSGGVVISRNVTVDGHGITIDGAHLARIFQVTAGNVTFRNINFVNGNADGRGGAVSGVCTAVDCNFTGNYAQVEGGAMYGGVAVKCIFDNNKAEDGGAMYDGVAINCAFVNNTADCGGAISMAVAINCTFTNNEAEGRGGAMFDCLAVNCVFMDNDAGDWGNSMHLGNAALCHLNYSDRHDTGIIRDLLAVSDFTSVSGDRLLFNLVCGEYVFNGFNTTISVSQNGAPVGTYYALSGEGWAVNLTPGIYNAALSVEDYDVNPVTVKLAITDGTTFCDLNRTINANNDSVIDLDRDYAFNSTTDSAFVAGIVIDRSVTVNGNGHAINANRKARIFNITDDVALKEITFANSSGVSGGAIQWSSNNAKILNCCFVNNTANHGGAIYFDRLTNATIISDCYNNTARYDGGAFVFSDLTNVTVAGDFIGNKAGSAGGAIQFFLMLNNVTVAGDFIGNKAGSAGGAIEFSSMLNNVTVAGVYINNSAGSGGANYFCDKLTNVAIAGDYINNSAGYGGANFFVRELTNGTVAGVYINNSASRIGGANYIYRLVNATISGKYVNNTAEKGGGAIYFSRITNVSLKGAFINNSGSSVILIENSNQNITIGDSIFINNNATNIEVQRGDLLLINSWFGNNASNYDVNMTDVKGIAVGNWLFLNATANPESVSFDETSDITFMLYAYDLENVTDYDNSLLQPVGLTITATNGDVDKNVSALGSVVKYSPNVRKNNAVTAAIENVAFTIDVGFTNPKPGLSINPIQDVSYGENATITLNYDPNATGKVNITLTGKKHGETYENLDLKTTLILPANVLPDEYEVAVTYSGDKNFKEETAYGKLTVNYLESSIRVVGYAINVTDSHGVMFRVILPENATGNFSISNGKLLNASNVGRKGNSSLIVDISNNYYAAGRYNWTFIYWGDVIYGNSSANAISNILKLNLTIEATADPIVFGENATVVVTAPADVEGNVTIRAGNYFNVDIMMDDTISFVIPGLIEDTLAEIYHSGDNYYGNASASVLIVVNPAPSAIDINGTEIYIGDDAVLNYTTVNATGIEVVVYNGLGDTLTEGRDYNITITDSQMIVRFFEEGIFTVNATTKTDIHHAPASKNATVIVNPICDLEVFVAAMNVTAHYGDTVIWNVTVVNHGPSYPCRVYVEAYAPEGLVFDSNGQGLTFYSNGAYVSSYYRLNIPFTLCPEIPFSALIMTAVNVSQANLTLNVSVADSYFQDSNPNNNNASATVEIERATSSVDVDVSSEIGYGDSLEVHVKLPGDAAGTVTVSAAGRNYTQNVIGGNATVSVPGLSAGTSNITLTYSGDKRYYPAEKIVSVTVTKATAKLTASAKTFNDIDKTKSYTVTLKDGKGNPIKYVKVSLRVNGVTYTVKTNGKGQATFKLNKLTKIGTFTATVAYPGDNNYNAVSAKVKLTVKVTWKTISKGSKNKAMVKKIQKALKKHGYYLRYNGHYLKVDGIFQEYTVKAVKQFQKANKLKVTGKVDYNTARKLKLI